MYRDLSGERKVERLILKEGVTREDVIQHAIAENWVALGTQQRTATKPFQYLWRTDARDAHIFYLEEIRLEYAFLEVESADRDALARIISGILEDTARVPVYTDAEVFNWSETAATRQDKIGAVYLAALSSPKDFALSWLPLYQRAASDTDPAVRRASLYAMSQTGWPQFRALAASLAEKDPDEKVRSTAAYLQGILERKHGTPADDL